MLKKTTLSPFQRAIFLVIGIFNSAAIAQTSQSTMSDEAKSAQKMQNVLYPQIQLPVTYNYNQKLGANNLSQQNQYGFNPIIPVALGSDLQLIVNPMLTLNHNTNDQQVTNQAQPLQLATYFGPAYAKYFYAGIGPYFQLPANNTNNGSKQTGLGISAGAYFTPDHWVIGAVAYNSWGVGSNMAGGSANVFNIQPSISYTTDAAWTYNLGSQITYNYDAKAATNQLTLSGGKTVNLFGYHTQVQAGPTYMITTTPTSAKGFGGYLGLTVLLPK
ncbi:hypothetical protein [Polynucleobacter sp. AP-Latsch-80-C2]|uniref:hypothetical protein n=1 Tax=Polynucleobacter sp. AP-Latsch-80-C2 TaxID=2576931 RepID=UPI001C0BB601|nr:hypothetical protein [Polynucleobacter sp. AP-Latsch-80-C2]MBU3624367.1 hypothetical protein [Polynucleobacter sp. AP-Latsch-80-C2]